MGLRIMIVDDALFMRTLLRGILEEEGWEVVGEAADGRQAIARVQALEPDVIVMDIAMPDLGGLEATVEIRRQYPRTRILILSQYEDREYVRRLLKAGVSGYVLKKSAGAELAGAIRGVHRGGLVLDPEVARTAMEEARAPARSEAEPYETLTDREKQVLKLVAEGHSNKEVAEVLGISIKTAMSHRERVMEKLALHSRTELIRFALKQGIIRVED
jgi:DNA-binding NarL/FixJ family response regulator